MSVVLTVQRPSWTAHLHSVLDAFGEAVIPVVKGNGYGFGRRHLAGEALRLGVRTFAVGTVHELTDVLDLVAQADEVHVLTPTFDAHLDALPPQAVLTVGTHAQLRHLADRGVGNPIVVKLRSSMLRHGFAPGDLPEIEPVAYSIHPPLAGTPDEHLAEIEAWLPHLDPRVPVHVSHVTADALARLRERHPERTVRVRLGTLLWHGDKSMISLGADVLDVRDVAAGTPAGYRATAVPFDGSLVIIGAGSAHGVAPLADGRSPFHFARARLALLEPPHMHVSMALVPAGQPCPVPGDRVDVQRPLTTTAVDRIEWID